MTRALHTTLAYIAGITTTITLQRYGRHILARLLNGDADDAPPCKRPTLGPVHAPRGTT